MPDFSSKIGVKELLGESLRAQKLEVFTSKSKSPASELTRSSRRSRSRAPNSSPRPPQAPKRPDSGRGRPDCRAESMVSHLISSNFPHFTSIRSPNALAPPDSNKLSSLHDIAREHISSHGHGSWLRAPKRGGEASPAPGRSERRGNLAVVRGALALARRAYAADVGVVRVVHQPGAQPKARAPRPETQEKRLENGSQGQPLQLPTCTETLFRRKSTLRMDQVAVDAHGKEPVEAAEERRRRSVAIGHIPGVLNDRRPFEQAFRGRTSLKKPLNTMPFGTETGVSRMVFGTRKSPYGARLDIICKPWCGRWDVLQVSREADSSPRSSDRRTPMTKAPAHRGPRQRRSRIYIF